MPIPNVETQLVMERIEHALFARALESVVRAYVADDRKWLRPLGRILAQSVHQADMRASSHTHGILPESIDQELVRQRGRADAAAALMRLAARCVRG